jgi:hypothetical protein
MQKVSSFSPCQRPAQYKYSKYQYMYLYCQIVLSTCTKYECTKVQMYKYSVLVQIVLSTCTEYKCTVVQFVLVHRYQVPMYLVPVY